jgi:transcriptional regulator with XRE-family HTH domain
MEDKETFYKLVGARIREHRGKNLSQEALASAVGLTRTSISNIEKGRQKLLLHTLADIATALKIDTSKLLPERQAPEHVGEATLAGLQENERVFIESAIGLNKVGKGHDGRQTTKNSRTGGDAPEGEQYHRGTGASLGNRSKKRSANRS